MICSLIVARKFYVKYIKFRVQDEGTVSVAKEDFANKQVNKPNGT
jgi:hypothetical protein